MEGRAVSVANAAKRLKCTKQTVYKHIRLGNLDKVNVEGKQHFMVSVESINRMILRRLQEEDYEFDT